MASILRKHHDHTASDAFQDEHDRMFGIFYPKGFAVVIFQTLSHAQKAKATAIQAGFSEEDVSIRAGDQVTAEIQHSIQDAGWFERMKQKISEAVGTEADYWKKDLEHAENGAAFMLIRCEKPEEGEHISTLLKPHNPISMRAYFTLIIEEFI